MLRQQQDDADEENYIILDKAVDLLKTMDKVLLVQRSINNAIKEGLTAMKDILAVIAELQKIRLEALNKEPKVVDCAMSAQASEKKPKAKPQGRKRLRNSSYVALRWLARPPEKG